MYRKWLISTNSRIWSRNNRDDRTSSSAMVGSWHPYLQVQSPKLTLRKWSLSTWKEYCSLFKRPCPFSPMVDLSSWLNQLHLAKALQLRASTLLPRLLFDHLLHVGEWIRKSARFEWTLKDQGEDEEKMQALSIINPWLTHVQWWISKSDSLPGFER